MEWQQLIIDVYIRISQELTRALEGLTKDDLNQQPSSDTNSIGWIAWHLTRTLDRGIGDLMGREQVWVEDRWYATFDRAPNPADTGLRHSSRDVAAFKSPNGKTLLDYHSAVLELYLNYLRNKLSETDLQRKVNRPTLGITNTVHEILLSNISDAFQHVGQAAYVRGILKDKGWSSR
ncbi:MAG: DinB family protein [Dehalococcoidia bacterium]|nr:MAG: DinB family protein [Dehalococcoidia bacterium]